MTDITQPGPVSPEQMVSMLLGFADDLDAAQKKLVAALQREVEARSVLTYQMAEAYRKVEGSNREQREAFVAEMVEDAHRAMHTAQNQAKAAMEEVRNKRQQLSAIQTVSNHVREEMAFHRTGQDELHQERTK